MSDQELLEQALDWIANTLTDTQKRTLARSWERAQRLEEAGVAVKSDNLQTAQALVRIKLAWNPSGTPHFAELNELGTAVAAWLSTLGVE